MFFGATSSAISGGSFCRRIRLRSAIATARLAWCWPTTYLSSSATICRGVIDWMVDVVLSGRYMGMASGLQDFYGQRIVGVDADRGGDMHRLLRDAARIQARVLRQPLGRRQRVRAPSS